MRGEHVQRLRLRADHVGTDDCLADRGFASITWRWFCVNGGGSEPIANTLPRLASELAEPELSTSCVAARC